MKNLVLFFLFLSNLMTAQVIDKIKTRSTENKSNHSSGNNNRSQSNSGSNSSPKTYNNNYNSGGNYNNSNNYNNNSNYNYNTNYNNNNCNSNNQSVRTRTKNNNAYSSYLDTSKSEGGIVYEQQRLLAKNDTNSKDFTPDIVSVEIYSDISTNNSLKTIAYNLRARGNYGMFSSEMRLFHLYENTSLGQINNYTNFDWQILQLNAFSLNQFKLRIGAGFTYEDFSKLVFFDWGVSTDIYPIKQLKLRLDYRNNFDFVTSISPRTYMGGAIEYKIYGNKLTPVVFFAGISVHKSTFYDSVNLTTIGPVINIRFQ